MASESKVQQQQGVVLCYSGNGLAEEFNQTNRREMACFSWRRRLKISTLSFHVFRLSVETWTWLRVRHAVFVLGANVLLSAPPIRQDTGKQKNQHFDMVSMALQPCCEEHQTLRAAGDLSARLRGYLRGSRALTGLPWSYSGCVSNACFEVLSFLPSLLGGEANTKVLFGLVETAYRAHRFVSGYIRGESRLAPYPPGCSNRKCKT